MIFKRRAAWHLITVFVAFTLLSVPKIVIAAGQNENSFKAYLSNISVIGKRISKSSSVRLAIIRSKKISISNRNTYLPAGKILLLTGHCSFSSGRNWCFAITEDGIGVFVLVKGEHYFKINENLEKIAVAMRNGEESDQNGNTFRYWTSRPYEVVDTYGQSITILIDTSEGNKGYKVGDEVKVSDFSNKFTLIDTQDFRSRSDFSLIRPVFSGELIDSIFESIGSFSLSKTEKAKIKGLLLKKNLVEKKVCDSIVEFITGADLGAGIDIGGILSAVNLKLGVTAKFSAALKYEKGTAFDTYRFIRESTDGSSPRFFEAWVRQRRDGNSCDKDISSVEITASDDVDFGGGRGSLTTDSATELDVEISETNKLPRYTCRDEYFRIIRHLTQTDGELTREAAELFVAYILRFEDATNASRCKRSS